MSIHGRFDHEIKIGSTTKRLKLIRDDKGMALYNVVEDIPAYQPQLTFTQKDWIGGHGQYDYEQEDLYFEGSAIDTTQEGRVILGPYLFTMLPSTFGIPVEHFCWFSVITKPMAATATRVYWFDGTNWIMKWDRANHDWEAGHSFTTADWLRPTTYNGHIYQCTIAGTGGAEEPTDWKTTDGETNVTGNATFTCRSIAITGLTQVGVILYVCLGSSAKYYYSTEGATYTVTDLTDGYAEKIFAAPNSARTATVLWKFKTPNELSNTTDGRTVAAGGIQWSSPAYIGDTSSDITNIFLVNDDLMIGKEDNLFHYDTDGGVHPLMDELKQSRSSNNFKYVTHWQGAVYFSLGTGLGEIASYNAYEVVGPLAKIHNIGKVGTCVGLTSDKDWLYVAMDEEDVTFIYKGREINRRGVLRWEWCPWVTIGIYTCAAIETFQHTSTDRRLWIGYTNRLIYVVLSDNPTSDPAARFSPNGWLRMSYAYGTDPNWDKLWQSAVIEQTRYSLGVETVASDGETVTLKYRDDTDIAVVATPIIAAYNTAGAVETNFTSALNNKRISFELHLASDTSTATPEVSYFQAKGVEKPTTVRIHEAVYALGDEPSKRAKTIRTFLREGRTSTTLIKFADLRFKETTAGTSSGDYVWCIMQPGYPQEVEVLHERGRQPELGIKVRLQEVSFTIS